MDEDLKLYIPLGVKPEAELFTGFGKKQLFQALIRRFMRRQNWTEPASFKESVTLIFRASCRQ